MYAATIVGRRWGSVARVGDEHLRCKVALRLAWNPDRLNFRLQQEAEQRRERKYGAMMTACTDAVRSPYFWAFFGHDPNPGACFAAPVVVV
eukprot:11803329-Alexandrium_andersonii.AAC.1